MFTQTVPLFLLASFTIIIGSFVLARDYRKLANITFFLLSLSVAAWILGIAAFSIVQTPNAALWWAKFYYAAPILLVLFLILFSISFPNNSKLSLLKLTFLLVAPTFLISLLLVLPNFITAGVSYHDWGKEILLNKRDYQIYGFYIITYFAIGLGLIYRKSQTETGLYRKQASLFVFGGVISAILGVLFNLILPWFGNYRLIWVGPLATSVFLGSAAVSIVRHKMFDVRIIVARTLGYFVSLFVLAAIYGFVVFGLAELLTHQQFSLRIQIVLSATAATVSLFFPNIKRFFDQQTNKLFFRDAYDTEEFLSEINKAVVANVDVEVLLEKVVVIVDKYLKTQFTVFDLRETVYVDRRIIGNPGKDYARERVSTIDNAMIPLHQRVVVTDDLEESHKELYQALHRQNVAIAIRLAPTIKYEVDGFGVLLLGPKKSGNPYNKQDINIVRIIAGELAIAIQNALRYEEIEKFNITLQEKVDEATRELRKTNEKLQALDEAKDEFISMASHQLRTPLTSVKGYISMVMEGDAGKITGAQRKLLNQSFISSQRMVYLIADLLNVSRLRTGKFILESKPTSLAYVVESEIKQLIETAASRSLELTYNKPVNFPMLMLDETKIRQVVMNFIDNAIYYTPAGGHITVNLVDKPSSVELTVADDGIGVPKHEQPHLFSKFYRAANAKKARPDGTGLGLFMAKKVIIAHGGSLIFKSEEGKGSTFGFSFAKSKLAVPAHLTTPPKTD